MHYRQTIIDALVTALDADPLLTGLVNSVNFYPTEQPVAVRVIAVADELEQELRIQDETREPRSLSMSVRLTVYGADVQSLANTYLEAIEGVSPGALSAVSDCAFLERVDMEISADQDNETLTAAVDYTVEYVTVLGDPSTRV